MAEAKVDEEKVQEFALEGLKALLNNDCTISDLQGLTDEELEAIYTLAYNFYRAGSYEKAEKVFHYLCIVNHLEIKYWIALGACEQMQKNYEGAIRAYAYASMLDLKDPRPQLHAAECYIALKNRDMAQSALGALLEYCPDVPEKKSYRDRAKALNAMLEKA